VAPESTHGGNPDMTDTTIVSLKLKPTLERILAAAVPEYRVSDLTDFPGQQGGAVTATQNPLNVLVPLLGVGVSYGEWRPPGDIMLRSEWRLFEVRETDCVRLGELTTLWGRDVDDHECDECDGSGTIRTWPYPNSVVGLMRDLCEALGWALWSVNVLARKDSPMWEVMVVIDTPDGKVLGTGTGPCEADASIAAFLDATGVPSA